MTSRWRLFIGIAADLVLLAVWLLMIWLFQIVAHALGSPNELEWMVARWLFALLSLGHVALVIVFDIRSLYAKLNVDLFKLQQNLKVQREVGIEGASDAINPQ